MPPEKPKTPPVAPVQKEVQEQKVIVPSFVERKEEIRQALGVDDEEKDSWEAILNEVHEDLRLPNDPKIGPVQKYEMQKRFSAYSEDQFIVRKMLLAVLYKLDNDPKNSGTLDQIERNAVLRKIANYLTDVRAYKNESRIAMFTVKALPGYLSQFLDIGKKDEAMIRAVEWNLPLQHDVRKAAGFSDAVKPRGLTPEAVELIIGAARFQVKMKLVMDCLQNGKVTNDESAYEKLITAVGFPLEKGNVRSKNTIASAKFLVGYIAKYMSSIQEYANSHGEGTPEENLSSLTMSEALNCCALESGVGKLAEELGLNIKGLAGFQLPNLQPFVKKLFQDGDLFSENIALIALEPLAKVYGTDANNEQFQADARAVLAFLKKPDATKLSVGKIQLFEGALFDKQSKLLNAVLEQVTGQEQATHTVERLLQSAFIPIEDEKQDETQKDIAKELTSLIQDKNISVRDAFDLYYLMNTKSADFLLAYKAVHLLDKYGQTYLSIQLQHRLVNNMINIASGTILDAEATFEKMKLSKEAQTEVLNIRQTLLDSGINSFHIWTQHYYSFLLNYSAWITIPTTIVGAVGAGAAIAQPYLAVSKFFRTVHISGLSNIANMGRSQLREYLKIPASLSDEAVDIMQGKIRMLVNEYYQLSQRYHWPFEGRTIKNNAQAFVSALRSGDLGDMGKAMRAKYPHVQDAARVLSEVLSDEDEVRNALRLAGYTADQIETVKSAGDTGKLLSSVTKTGQAIEESSGAARIVSSEADEVAKAAKTIDQGGETFKTFKQLLDAIKSAKDNKYILKLLENPLIAQAAKQGDRVAKGLYRLYVFLGPPGHRFVKAIPYIGTLIDLIVIGSNEMAIADAKQQKNFGMQQTLEAKRVGLIKQGSVMGGAAVITYAAGAAGALATAPVVGTAAVTGAYTNEIYDAIVDWEKSPTDWLKLSKEQLKQQLDSITYGKVDLGKRSAVGYSPIYSLYRWGTSFAFKSSKKRNAAEDAKQGEAIEAINQNMRQEILTAYFLKTMKVGKLPEESDQAFKERVTVMVRDRLNLVRRLSGGKYITENLGTRIFDMAGDYANAASFRRSLPDPKTPFEYQWNNETKVLDLSALDYVQGSGNDEAGQMKYLQTMKQYQNEVAPLLQVVREFQAFPDPVIE